MSKKEVTESTGKERTKVVDLDNGISIWKVHIDYLREQDKNARSMSNTKFNRLADNIKRDNRLESMMLCVENEGRDEFSIISGHHRARAARAAGIDTVHIMVINETLTDSQIKSKQLSHNALSGIDDPQIVKEIYEAIEDIKEKMASGINEDEMAEMERQIDVDGIALNVDFEVVNIVFFPEHKEKFDRMLATMTAQTGENILISESDRFQAFKTAVQGIANNNNIRNVSTIINKMSAIVLEYYGIEEDRDKWVSIANILGTPTVPIHVARSLKKAIEKAVKKHKIKDSERYTVLEKILGEYLEEEE